MTEIVYSSPPVAGREPTVTGPISSTQPPESNRIFQTPDDQVSRPKTESARGAPTLDDTSQTVETKSGEFTAARETALQMISGSEPVFSRGLTNGKSNEFNELPGFLSSITDSDRLVDEGRNIMKGTSGGTALGGPEKRAEITSDFQLMREAIITRLSEIIFKSRNPEMKLVASIKNATDSVSGFWRLGDLLHSVDDCRNLEAILREGLTCSELHGEGAKIDTTPMRSDLTEILNTVSSSSSLVGDQDGGYSADRGGPKSIRLRFRREVGSTDYGEEGSGNYGDSPGHRTLFIGAPSTEISAVQIVGPMVNVSEIIATIVSNGQYIPVYGNDGSLLFSPADFEHATGSPIVKAERIDRATKPNQSDAEQIMRITKLLSTLGENSGGRDEFSSTLQNISGKIVSTVIREGSGETDTQIGASGITESDYRVRRVDIPLTNGRKLNIREKDQGVLDMFISSLDAPAHHIKPEDIPQLRHELAHIFSKMRSRFADVRAEKKVRESLAAEEEMSLPG